MKILLATAKTQKIISVNYKKEENIFPQLTTTIIQEIKKLNFNDLLTFYKTSYNIVEKLLSSQLENNYGDAFFSYDGLVFKNAKKNISISNYKYLENNILLVDAMYGLLKPFNQITNYRLDFTNKLNDFPNFYKFWESEVNNYLHGEVIINLMSQEYSKLINEPMINIVFIQIIKGQRKSQSTYTKIARGCFVNWLVLENITSIKDITSFNKENYIFEANSSSISTLTFVKHID